MHQALRPSQPEGFSRLRARHLVAVVVDQSDSARGIEDDGNALGDTLAKLAINDDFVERGLD
jgi:hypothetical protein